VAHAGGMKLDLDFVCDGIAHIDLVDLELRVELPEQRASGFTRVILTTIQNALQNRLRYAC
jgi:hypothetical protein